MCFIIFAGSVNACICTSTNSDIVSSLFEGVYIFEAKEKSILEKFRLTIDGKKISDENKWNLKIVEVLKGDVNPNLDITASPYVCPIIFENGDKFIGYTKNTNKIFVSSCNTIFIDPDKKKSSSQINEIKKAIANPVRPIKSNEWHNWTKIAVPGNYYYDHSRIKKQDETIELWIANKIFSGQIEPFAPQFKSSLSRLKINCKKNKFSMASEFYFSEINLRGKIVDAIAGKTINAPSLFDRDLWESTEQERMIKNLQNQICKD